MLRTLTATHQRFGLRAPFRIARGVKTAADVITVTIRQ
ncbi:MAG TPA: dipeptide epimerase, partial [Sphingomonas sp.]